jgi:ketosteroid isomerase-like protein
MSQENVERMRLSFDAFTRRDKVAWLELCDPDFEWVPIPEWPQAPIRGREAVWDFVIAFDEPWERGTLFEIVEVIDDGDKVVTHLRRDLRGKSSGIEVEYDYWLVLTFRDGKISTRSSSPIAVRRSKPPGCRGRR